MLTYGVWQNIDELSILDSLLVSLIAILIVFLVLVIIILVTSGFEKATKIVIEKSAINPRKENAILAEDSDAVAAVLAATIDFHKATGKNPRVVSVKRIEE